jgi:hypothetical protein
MESECSHQLFGKGHEPELSMGRFSDGGERWKQTRFRGPSSATDDLPLFQNADPQLMVREVLDLAPQDFRLRGALAELIQCAASATVGSDPSVGPGIHSLGQ